MKSNPVPTTNRWAYLWLALFALSAVFGGKWTVAAAAWIGPVFGLRFLRSQKIGRGILLLWAALYIPILISWHGITPFPMPIYPIFMLINALIGVLPYLLDRVLSPRLAVNGQIPFKASFIFPLAVTASEFILMTGDPMGSFGAQAYTQYGFFVFAQLASITGMWGITFLVAWFGSVVNWAWEHNFEWKQIKAGAITYTAIFLLVCAYGAIRLWLNPEPTQTVKVASFTAEEFHPEELFPLMDTDMNDLRAQTTAIHQKYLEQTVSAAQDGAKIVLWPEMAGSGYFEDVETLLEQSQTMAKTAGIYLAVPALSLFNDENRPDENILYIINPQGEIAIEHVKYGGNMLEGTLQGNGILQTIDTPYGRLSGLICWDTDYQEKVRQVGQMEADILLSPSYVWPEIGQMHLEMAAFRAIENGVTIIRQEDGGISGHIDAYGRLLITANHSAGERMIMADLPVLGIATLYPLIGDIFGQAAVVGLIFMILWAIIAGRKAKSSALVEQTSSVK
jgi:apolipoprotein N-acyltransferase